MAATKKAIEFAAWEPDVAILDGQAAHEAKNVLPAKRGYVPMPGLAELAFPALLECPLAVWTNKLGDNGENVICIVATAGGIYALEAGAWVQKYTGDTVSSNRRLVDYGADIYCLWGTTLLRGTLDGATLSEFEAVEGAPHGNILAVIQDFLCIGNTEDASNEIHWSAIDDPTDWPEVGTTEAANKQSDIQRFPTGGKVQAIVGGLGASVTGIVFLEHAVQLATYVGTPYIFQFSSIDRSRGLLASKSPVAAGSICVFLAEDGWRATDGETVKSIGSNRVNDWFFAECDNSRLNDIIGVHDVERRKVWWAFPSNSCAANVYDRVLIYDYEQDKWSWGAVACEFMFQDTVRGLTLEDLDEYGTLDSLPFASLDTSAMKPGRGVVGAFNTVHKMGTMNGPNLEAVITTAEFGGDRMMVHGLRPQVSNFVPDQNSEDYKTPVAKPVYRTREMDAQKFGDYREQSRDGVCYQHISTVYLTAQVEIPAGASWSHAVGVEALIEQEGGM